jgi:branched-chain amino acid transport system ATP-binding protein
MSQPLLSVESCRVTFGAVVALQGASLQLGPGEAVGVVGALGAGKSTLLRTVAGLAAPAEGRVLFEGDDLAAVAVDARARRGIIHVPAGGGFFPSLSVRENLDLAQHPDGTPEEVASMTGTFPVLGERLSQRAGSLSGGEQRQLAIARGVLARPRLFLLDEPLLGLSPTTVQRVVHLLSALHERGVAMVVVEERPTDELGAVCDRIVGMRGGRIVPVSDVDQSVGRRSAASGSLDRIDVEMLGVPLSTRDRRALQTIAQETGRRVGEIVADLVHEHVLQHEEVWQ